MAAQEIGHLGIEAEAQEDLARVAQHHRKGHQEQVARPMVTGPKSGPVYWACSPGRVCRRR